MSKRKISLNVDCDNNAYFIIDGEAICWLTRSGELQINEEAVMTLGVYKVGGCAPRYVLRQDNEYEIDMEQTE